MTTGEKIAKLRKQAGYSQETFSEKLGISRQAVSKWENGTAAPTNDNMQQIARLFGVSMSALLDDEDINFTPIDDEAAEKLSEEIGTVAVNTKANKISLVFLTAAVIILAIASIVQSATIGRLKEKVESLEIKVHQLEVLKNQMDNLQGYVYSLPSFTPAESSKEFTDFQYKVKSYNRDNDTAVLAFSMVPADYSRNTTAKIVIKGESETYSVDALLENDIFTATVEVKCENNLAVYLYLTEGDNTRSFLLDYLPNPNTDYIMEIRSYGIEGGEKPFRMADGVAVVNLQLWCDVAFSNMIYPQKAVIEMYSDGKYVKEFPFESLMDTMSEREGMYTDDEAFVSFGHEVTCYQYILETVKSDNIKKNSSISWKIIITDNKGREYTAEINEMPV